MPYVLLTQLFRILIKRNAYYKSNCFYYYSDALFTDRFVENKINHFLCLVLFCSTIQLI